MGSDTVEVLRIEAGVPAVGVDTDDETLPPELPLEHAISFTKGCYMGQETAARIKNFGHINRKLVGLKLKELASPQASVLFEGELIGKITSIIESPKLEAFLALGLVRREQSNPGTRVSVAQNDRILSAEVVGIPL
jgi:folate-binding protein YgfZ